MRQSFHSRQQQILNSLSKLPRKILSAYDAQNLIQLVLHDLCNEGCFDISKATFFIDNPDFDHLQGIAGFKKEERYQQDPWKNPEQFYQFMQANPFYQKVRTYSAPSITRNQQANQGITQLADSFALKNPHHYALKMKNDNKGILIFEQPEEAINDELLDGFYLLGFCPLHS